MFDRLILWVVLSLGVLLAAVAMCNADHGSRPTIIMFTATYCAPCQQAKHELQWARRNGELDGIAVQYIDVQTRPEIARRYHVSMTPTFVFVQGYSGELYRTFDVHDMINYAKEWAQ